MSRAPSAGPEGSDVYHQAWDPRAYLRQYYTLETLSEDERANAAFLVRWLRQSGRRFRRALEFGCGPTIHHAAFLVPFVEELHLADYLPANLAEVRKWLDAAADAHDWDAQLSGILAMGQAATGTADPLQRRKADLRRRARLRSARPGLPRRHAVLRPGELRFGHRPV